MTTFAINNENEIAAFATTEEAAGQTATPFGTFSSQQELAEPAQPAKSKARRKATGRAQGAGVAPAKGKATKKPTPAKKAD